MVIALGIHFRRSEIRVLLEGWVERNSGGTPFDAFAIRCQRRIDSLGSYPASAANSNPIWSASDSWLRLNGKSIPTPTAAIARSLPTGGRPSKADPTVTPILAAVF